MAQRQNMAYFCSESKQRKCLDLIVSDTWLQSLPPNRQQPSISLKLFDIHQNHGNA